MGNLGLNPDGSDVCMVAVFVSGISGCRRACYVLVFLLVSWGFGGGGCVYGCYVTVNGEGPGWIIAMAAK